MEGRPAPLRVEATAGKLALEHNEDKLTLLVCALIKDICPSEPLTLQRK